MRNATSDAAERRVAYFSMEIAFDVAVPTYAGGLGVLAADTIRSAADLRVPMVAVTLIHRMGYFRQRFDDSGWQIEEPDPWRVEEHAVTCEGRVSVEIGGRSVQLRAWCREVCAPCGYAVPVLLLDADLPENTALDRGLTDHLYGGDERYRLAQEVVLGIGGIRMLRALGYRALERFHLNEGHAALLILELLRERREARHATEDAAEDFDAVRRQCVFTTHTPVAAGHDHFSLALVDEVVGSRVACGIRDPICTGQELNLTHLALAESHYINGVAKRHADLSAHMFAAYKIDAITNGVHAATWTSAPFADLYDRHIPGWRDDNFSLRYALSIPADEIWRAHVETRQTLFDEVARRTGVALAADALTLGYARRATAYKRPDLILSDLERLKRLARAKGRIQLLFAGKAHPHDRDGKLLLQRVFEAARESADEVRIVVLPGYDLTLAKWMVSGVDVWINTPEPPLEASGTSGMKAALNGVPSLSVLDGWWIEGCIEGVTGWGIGGRPGSDRPHDADALYAALEEHVSPLFHAHRDRFIDVMRHAIALNGAFFNTQRMVQQYVLKAYFE